MQTILDAFGDDPTIQTAARKVLQQYAEYHRTGAHAGYWALKAGCQLPR